MQRAASGGQQRDLDEVKRADGNPVTPHLGRTLPMLRRKPLTQPPVREGIPYLLSAGPTGSTPQGGPRFTVTCHIKWSVRPQS